MTTTYPKIEMVLDETTLTFEKEEVVDAVVIQEVDPISSTVPINKVEFHVISEDDSFNMFSSGYIDLLGDRPPVTVYEVEDGADTLLGKFYLEDWENISENEYKFMAMDIMGVLNETPFEGRFWSSLTSVETILESVLGEISVSYSVESWVGSKTLKGWIPPGTYRSGLQHVLFAAGAVAKTARETEIKIVRNEITDYYAIFDDAGNDYMSFPVYSPGADSFTIEIFCRINTGPGYENVFDLIGSTANVVVYYNPDKEQVTARIRDDSNNTVWPIRGDDPVVGLGEWGHFAIVVDRSSDQAIGYVDGEEGTVCNISGFGNITTDISAFISQDPESDVAYVRIWSGTRTQTEIQENMYRRTPLDETGLVRNYTYAEKDETDFKSGQDGTFAGTITFGQTPGQYVLPAYDDEVLDSEKFMDQKVVLKPLVTSIELVSHNYSKSSELLDIYEEDLDAGTYKIIFDQPYYDIVIDGPGYMPAALLTEDEGYYIVTEDENYGIEVGGEYQFGPNSVTLEVSSPGGTVTITGYPYVDSQRAFTFTEEGVTTATDLNKLEVPKATLVSTDNVEEVLNMIRDYYQIRYEKELKLLPTTLKPHDIIQTSTLYDTELVGPVEKMEIDLTRGYLAKVRMIGREV